MAARVGKQQLDGPAVSKTRTIGGADCKGEQQHDSAVECRVIVCCTDMSQEGVDEFICAPYVLEFRLPHLLDLQIGIELVQAGDVGPEYA